MNSIYEAHLPRTFPYVLRQVPYVRALTIAAQLLQPSQAISEGSSYAVTSDVDARATRNIWLSKVSADRVRVLHPDLVPQRTSTERE